MGGQELDGEEGDTNGFSVHLTGKGHMVTIGAPQYKWKLDKDHAFFNAAVEPLHSSDYEPEAEAEDDEDEDDEDDEPMPTGNASRSRVRRTSPKAMPAPPSNDQRTLATAGYACWARSTANSWATLCRQITRTDSAASCASSGISRMALD